jgi:hypothetical protein
MSLENEIMEWTFDYIASIPYNYDSKIENKIYYSLPLVKKVSTKSNTYDYHRQDSKLLKDKTYLWTLKDAPAGQKSFYFAKQFNTHGESGGNCWGGSPSPYHNDIPEDFNFDDYTVKLCHKFCPDISFIQYKMLLDECIVTEDYKETEYYGNINYYRLKLLDISKLVSRLKQR